MWIMLRHNTAEAPNRKSASQITGQDTYALCEINVSSVFPIPEEAPEAIAATVIGRLETARRHSVS